MVLFLARVFSEPPCIPFCQIETQFSHTIALCRNAFSGFTQQAMFLYPILGNPATMYQPVANHGRIMLIDRTATPVFIQHGRYGQVYSSATFPTPPIPIVQTPVLPQTPPRSFGFYKNVIYGYVQSLRTPLQNLLNRMDLIIGNPHATEADFDKVLEEKKRMVSDLKTKIEGFMTMDSEVYLTVLKHVVDLALSSDQPLFKDGNPTLELPLDLGDLSQELETVRQMQESPEKQALCEQFVPRLMQGLPNFQTGLGNAWRGYLKRPDFLSLKKSLGIEN